MAFCCCCFWMIRTVWNITWLTISNYGTEPSSSLLQITKYKLVDTIKHRLTINLGVTRTQCVRIISDYHLPAWDPLRNALDCLSHPDSFIDIVKNVLFWTFYTATSLDVSQWQLLLTLDAILKWRVIFSQIIYYLWEDFHLFYFLCLVLQWPSYKVPSPHIYKEGSSK